MSRIEKAFQKKKALVAYLTAGPRAKEGFLALLRGGADLLEIGIPFSDPIADGPTIQKAMVHSLQAKTTLKSVYTLISDLRKETEAALIVFTYYNPIQKNLEPFLQELKKRGADGVLIVDLPMEEATCYQRLCRQIGLDPIFVIAPTTSLSRIRSLARLASGFLYYACRKGTTGARDELPLDLKEKIAEVRSVSSLPIAVGFGIASSDAAKAVLEVADGVVIGSYFVEALEKGLDLELLAKKVRP